MKEKHTLRSHLKLIEEFHAFIQEYEGIDFFRRVAVSNHLFKRINRIREYLNMEKISAAKSNFRDIIRNNLKHMKDK